MSLKTRQLEAISAELRANNARFDIDGFMKLDRETKRSRWNSWTHNDKIGFAQLYYSKKYGNWDEYQLEEFVRAGNERNK